MNHSSAIRFRVTSKWLLAPACLATMAVAGFCCFYLLSDYNYLVAWYFKLNNCFYARAHWQSNFFGPGTKQQGNLFCIAGLVLCLLMLYLLVWRLKKPAEALTLRLPKQYLWVMPVCLLAGAAAWLWGNSLVHQGFDEVFSAVDCASLPPFQTLSYYMLPNNHILFNTLNSVLFGFADDQVFTGKLISLACYCGTILVMFFWVAGIVKNKVLLIIITVVMALQFPVWGFGFEARGYALYTFTAWLAFFTLMRYVQNNNRQWLYYCTVTIVAGYWCLPAFLYFHSALILFGVFWMVYARTWDSRFWKMQMIIVLAVFILYLPAICFSGIHALIANQYVSGHIHTLAEFYTRSKGTLETYLSFYTASFTKQHHLGDVVIFVLPLTLFCFYRNRMAVLCGFFYLAMWSSCIILAYVMEVYPIDRAMSAHFSVSLGLTIYALYLAFQKLNETVKVPGVTHTVLIILLVLQGVRFGAADEANVSPALYNNDINSKYELIVHQGIDSIPKGSTIAFSDECFYWYYQCKLRGYPVNKCISGNEQYFVRLSSEVLPAGYAKRYKLIKTIFKRGITAVSYEIYKKI
jgi:hypothetical protein